MPKNEEQRALVVSPFEGLNLPAEQLAELQRELDASGQDDLAGVSPFALMPRAKVEKSNFEIGGKPVTSIVGVIVDNYECNGYWLPKAHPLYDEANNAPICVSIDTITGSRAEEDVDSWYGVPYPSKKMYGNCRTCVLNSWGSGYDADKGKFGAGRACKNQRRLFVMDVDKFQEGHDLPIMVTLSPSSLKEWATYMGILQQSRVRRSIRVLTTLSVEKKTDGSRQYGIVKFQLGHFIPPVLMVALLQWRKDHGALLRGITDAELGSEIRTPEYDDDGEPLPF